MAGGDRQKLLRGGKQSRRDRWFGLKGRPGFPDFERWFHRKGKPLLTGGRDVETKEHAEACWDEWQRSGRPKVKWAGDR